MKKELSAGTQTAIKQQERNSEFLIHWIQIVFIIFVGLLYLISKKGFPINFHVEFQPVPYVLSFYFIVLLGRLFLLYKDVFSEPIIYVSIFIDISILAILIWSYHVQYAQISAFYLKAPTFMYFFFFIALRSLRYNAKHIFFAGGCTIAWWTFLTIYAANTSPIAESFIEYGIRNVVLIGVEIDKMLAIAIVSFVLILGGIRSRTLLATAEEEAATVQAFSRFFSPEVADKIQSSDKWLKPGYGKIRDAVSLMIDLRKFSKLSFTISPEKSMEILSNYHKVVIPIILKNKGTIDKFLGDGVLIHFGAADESEYFAANALRTADELLEGLTQWCQSVKEEENLIVDFGISACYGKLIFGTIGDSGRLEFTIIGPPVNTAAKMEDHNKTLQTRFLTTQETYALAQEQGYIPKYDYETFSDQKVGGLNVSLELIGIKHI